MYRSDAKTKIVMEQNYFILSIETSCDETSVAIFNNQKLLSHVISSSSENQAAHGGVVPELASRYHEQNIVNVYLEAIQKANIDPFIITHIAYTAFPGLPGCLHVGKVFAKELASLLNAELVPINHLHAHAFSAIIDQPIHLPALALVVSGGETVIYQINDYDEIKVLNQTQDDAVGEVFDKVARTLGWAYPGGPIIDKNYDPKQADIQFIKQAPVDAMFSFSGLKTAIINYIHNHSQKKLKINAVQIASSFQKFAINEIVRKVQYYLNQTNLKHLLVGGGVSANSLLRSELLKLDTTAYLPQLLYTGDNAAMIGAYAYGLIKNNKKSILVK